MLKQHPSRNLGLGYPPENLSAFVQAIAEFQGAKPENVMISTGSGEILDAAVMAYCNGDKSLVHWRSVVRLAGADRAADQVPGQVHRASTGRPWPSISKG